MLIDSKNGSFEVKYNFYTLYLYEQEFGSDLIKDLYGNIATEIGDSVVGFDFGLVNWTSVVKALWAGAKCANPATPRFKDWAQTVDINLFDEAGKVLEEINGSLFRFGVASVSE